MANKTTFTQVSALTAVLSIIDTFDGDFILVNENQYNKADLVEKISAMVETLEKKKTSISKADKEKADATNKVLATITNVLVALDKPATISEIQAGDADLATYSNQKMSAMLKKLVDGGKVEKVIEKKKAYFRLINA